MGPWECAQRDTDPLSLLRKWYLCERRPQRASSMPFPQLLCFPSSTSDTTVCSGQRHEGRRHRHSFCQGQHRLIPLSEHPCNSTGSSEAMAKTKQRVCLRGFWLTRPFLRFISASSFNPPCFWEVGAKSKQLVFSWTRPKICLLPICVEQEFL